MEVIERCERLGRKSLLGIEYPVTSFLVLETPAAVTRFVLPSGAPMSVNAVALLSIHFFHACMPAFICSGVDLAIICSMADTGARYNTKNLLMTHLDNVKG